MEGAEGVCLTDLADPDDENGDVVDDVCVLHCMDHPDCPEGMICGPTVGLTYNDGYPLWLCMWEP